MPQTKWGRVRTTKDPAKRAAAGRSNPPRTQTTSQPPAPATPRASTTSQPTRPAPPRASTTSQPTRPAPPRTSTTSKTTQIPKALPSKTAPTQQLPTQLPSKTAPTTPIPKDLLQQSPRTRSRAPGTDTTSATISRRPATVTSEPPLVDSKPRPASDAGSAIVARPQRSPSDGGPNAIVSRPRPPSDAGATIPRPPTPRAPSDGTATRGSMDDFCARRLVDAWRAKDKQALPPRIIPGTKGSFYAGHAHAIVELEFDAQLRTLIVRRSPLNSPYDAPPDRFERERIAAMAEEKAAKLRGTTTEIVELRSRPKKWFVVMRRDFGDPTITDAAFLSAMDDLMKLMVVWRA